METHTTPVLRVESDGTAPGTSLTLDGEPYTLPVTGIKWSCSVGDFIGRAEIEYDMIGFAAETTNWTWAKPTIRQRLALIWFALTARPQ